MQPATLLCLRGEGEFVLSPLDMHYFLLTTEMAAKLVKLISPGVMHHDLCQHGHADFHKNSTEGGEVSRCVAFVARVIHMPGYHTSSGFCRQFFTLRRVPCWADGNITQSNTL